MSISEANGESLSRSTDDSDLEWRKENEISYDDEDSSDLDKYCDESDTEEWFGEHYDSDEAEHKNFKRLSRNENFVDPNSKLPRPKNENIYENGKIVLRQWQRFKDHKVFGAVLKDFAIQEGFELRKVKHASSRITSVCRAEGCKWRIHASLSPDEREFIIKIYNPDHNCQCVVKNRIATSGWIAKKLSSTLAKTPDMNLQRMRLELKDQFGIEATNRQLWKARQKAREHGGLNYAHLYGNLRRYAAMIYKTNPGSAAIIQSVKTGFLTACRPFFGLDGCHLKGPYKGILLAAVGLDANLHFYPIAYAIVEAQNNSSWKWFLDFLRNEIGILIEANHGGLIEVVTNIPGAGHRFCCFHLENNMVKKFGTSHLQGLFWAAAETANFENFKIIIERIKEFNQEAHDWLSNIDFKHWTMSKFDPNVKVEHLTNNFVESFNDWIEDHRYKAPIELLEGIRMQQTAMMYAREVTADRWEHKLTPKVHLKWQVRGIPCIHAIACITTIRADIANYCSPYFTTEMWRKTFEQVIHPIPDESMWPQFNDVKKPPGRSKKHRRRRVAGEERPLPPTSRKQPTRKGVSSTKKCSNCHEFGHNSRSC
ncbi:uncharacterized protein LOC115716177 [Cannabis sativa]|uniref:uncharacterized protein LOC115716177 n=1 Tax=Cannabis sativa TaxID=3483 RepID=UPI0029CA3AAC|nr:uncharacterized protein LOC115716177 [Cannabis sativa]